MDNINLLKRFKIYFNSTNALIILNVILYIITILLSGLQVYSYIILGAQVLPGTVYPLTEFVLEPSRFVTSAFLHGGLAHLLFNMYALFSIGKIIEEFYGGKKLFLVYIYTAIGASILSFLGSFIGFWNNNNIANNISISVGASGAIFGLVGLILGYKYLKRKTYGAEIDFDSRPLIFFVLFNLVFGFGVNAVFVQTYINNWAHLGGLLTGIFLGAILNTKYTSLSKWGKRFESFLYYSSIIIFVLSFLYTIFRGLNLFFKLI